MTLSDGNAFALIHVKQPRCRLVVFVPSDTPDIVPGVGLVAEIALVHARMFLPRNYL